MIKTKQQKSAIERQNAFNGVIAPRPATVGNTIGERRLSTATIAPSGQQRDSFERKKQDALKTLNLQTTGQKGIARFRDMPAFKKGYHDNMEKGLTSQLAKSAVRPEDEDLLKIVNTVIDNEKYHNTRNIRDHFVLGTKPKQNT